MANTLGGMKMDEVIDRLTKSLIEARAQRVRELMELNHSEVSANRIVAKEMAEALELLSSRMMNRPIFP